MRISCLYTSLNIAALAITTMAIAAPQGGTQKKPPAPKPPAVNQVKGQQQLAGASVQFGTVYSLKNGFNFAVLAARYTLEPFVAYAPLTAKTDMKLLVLDFAIKNANPDDNFFNPEDMLTLVDDKGQLYTGGSMALSSKKADTASVTLRPGQGLGQPELKDP
ncbi:MAG: hypothetical protein JOZ57_08365, partial [Abitibacteriaceae bacterium]|nr:hypothetical protein [Abditibacteriaceae bacterium]